MEVTDLLLVCFCYQPTCTCPTSTLKTLGRFTYIHLMKECRNFRQLGIDRSSFFRILGFFWMHRLGMNATLLSPPSSLVDFSTVLFLDRLPPMSFPLDS